MGLVLTDGNEAIVMGAVYAGCRFFASYPITPASTLFKAMLKLLPPKNGIVIQGEDEIASIGFCLGASMAGLKTMTATSGPGLSLYSENISFAIAGEIPIVIVNVMRQGPSTGSATRGADGDVCFMRWGNSGGIPVIVLAPVDVRDCFILTAHAFNLAEQFRCPVFIASNKEIAMTRETLDLNTIKKPAVIDRTYHACGPFFPFGVDQDNGVPHFLPVGGPTLVRQTSSTHGKEGYITTNPVDIQAGVERLKKKIESQLATFSFVETEIKEKSRLLILTYGVTARAVKEAAQVLLKKFKTPVSILIIKTLWPVPEDVIVSAGEKVKKVLVVEMNLGQYVYEVRRVLCRHEVDFYGKMSGQLITPMEIIKKVLNG